MKIGYTFLARLLDSRNIQECCIVGVTESRKRVKVRIDVGAGPKIYRWFLIDEIEVIEELKSGFSCVQD
jgi:hypothetical protein